MDDNEKSVYEVLEKLHIHYEKHDHPAVFTCREADIYTSGLKGVHTKNLFLRNKKGDKHYLVVMCEDKVLDVKAFGEIIHEKNISFASPERMMKYLKLTPGSVSLFGIINDTEHAVKVYIDEDIMKEEFINSHPNVNTSTLVIKVSDMIRFLEDSGNQYQTISLKISQKS
ncbi:MAG: prolyl-tRNA synthetase associated protein [Sedimentibacter sp.]|jgi:Ala-tRNA(Pro) deacylase|nr:prolyl-tRNA synthetase associated protein [Sedimentibacter sp.]